MNGDGQDVPCCAWTPDAWVPPYMSLASVMLLWTVFLFGQFRIFTISGTVAQWSALLLCCLPVLVLVTLLSAMDDDKTHHSTLWLAASKCCNSHHCRIHAAGDLL